MPHPQGPLAEMGDFAPITRTSNWITLASGMPFDYDHPRALTIGEVAVGLSNICRFTGHCNSFYSVAQHSVLVSRLVPPKLALWGLLHDAHEAVMGDVNTPLKRMLPDYRALEREVEYVVLAGFGLHGPKPPEVKHADLVALATERRDLMPHDGHSWVILDGVAPHPTTVDPQPPCVAWGDFIRRYRELAA